MAQGRPLDPDSTIALLSGDLPSVPNYPENPEDSEEEVFFGEISDREKNGRNAKFNGRPTLDHNELSNLHRRSWQVNSKYEFEIENRNPNNQFSQYREKKSYNFSIASSIGEEKEVEEVDISQSPDINNKYDSEKDIVMPLRELRIDSIEKDMNFSPNASSEGDSFRSRSPLGQSGRIIPNLSSQSLTRVEESEESGIWKVQDSLETGGADDLNASFTNEVASPLHEIVCTNSSLNSSTASNWFDNTHDEMVLYEKFGENYDDVVAQMSIKERRQLKREVAKMTPKSAQELLNDQIEEEFDLESTPAIQVEPPTPKPRTMTPQKIREMENEKEIENKSEKFSPRMVQSQIALKMLKDDLALALTPKKKSSIEKEAPKLKQKSPKTSPKPDLATPLKKNSPKVTKEPIFKTPTSKQHQKKPISAQKTQNSAMKTPRNYPKSPSYLRPTSASKRRASPKKDVLTNETLDITVCTRHGHAHTANAPYICHTPSPFKDKKKIPCSVDLRKIVSPVAQYIKEHPAPPLIRQVKPSRTGNKHQTEDAIAAAMDGGDKFGTYKVSKKSQFAALPEAVYKSSKMALEEEVDSSAKFAKEDYVSKAYGKPDNVEAVVVRHVGREKVPSYLKPKDHEMKPGTKIALPSYNQRTATLTMAASRDSMATYKEDSTNDSDMEMSIREVKKVTMKRNYV